MLPPAKTFWSQEPAWWQPLPPEVPKEKLSCSSLLHGFSCPGGLGVGLSPLLTTRKQLRASPLGLGLFLCHHDPLSIRTTVARSRWERASRVSEEGPVLLAQGRFEPEGAEGGGFIFPPHELLA